MDALPEPDVIAGAFDTLRVQSQRIANVGAIQGQQHILGAIQALAQQTNNLAQEINHLAQEIDQRFDQVNDRFDNLERRQNNFEISAVNARLFSANGAAILQQPVDVRNGGDIPEPRNGGFHLARELVEFFLELVRNT
ncbi:hypothetical protein B0T16DRAFT_384228 [Cercophora newfieldiana]|uniref:Uncharacterized protein n=1 Tax=Cercophora newfieldiana TaxID=92897 RepID=A0AA39YMR2_9PEZI|nr:hypothetical protein B0T16DRAFT_384228 [Cercophora newfieldiana]